MIITKRQQFVGGLLLTAVALLTGCSSDDTETAQVSRHEWHVSIPVGNAATRSVYLDGAVLKSKWNSNQSVIAYSDETSVGTLAASASEAGDATGTSTLITGDISGTYTAGISTLTLYSPTKIASNTYEEYATQDGTVEGTYGISSKDYLTATVTVTAADASSGLLSTSRASFSRLQSFTKFTFSKAVKTLVFSATGMSDITVTASGDQTDFYVALPLAGEVVYSITGTTDGGTVYSVQATGTLTHGNYYTATIDFNTPIDITTTINNWGDGGTDSDTITL